jgi:hypothetical protein
MPTTDECLELFRYLTSLAGLFLFLLDNLPKDLSLLHRYPNKVNYRHISESIDVCGKWKFDSKK